MPLMALPIFPEETAFSRSADAFSFEFSQDCVKGHAFFLEEEFFVT